MLDLIIRKAPNVYETHRDSSTLISHAEDMDSLVELDGLFREFWRLVAITGGPKQVMIDEVLEDFEVEGMSEAELRQALFQFLDQLKELNFIIEEPQTTP